MLPNILFRRIEQVGQLLLRQPDVIILKPRHDSRLTSNRTIDGELMFSSPIKNSLSLLFFFLFFSQDLLQLALKLYHTSLHHHSAL